MLRALLTRRVRGQALTELQVAMMVGAFVIGGFVYLFARQVATSATVNQYAANEAAVVSFFKEAQDDSAAAQAVFSPSNDVGGNSNADYHAADYYQWDEKHVGTFYEYCFKATAGECPSSQALGTLQRYKYLWSNLPQNGGTGATAQSSPIALFSGFSFRVLTTAAQYADATLDPYAYQFFVKHPASFSNAKSYHWGYPGVTSSTNDLYVIIVTLPNGETRSIAFGKHHVVFAQQVIYGTATPTPNPMCASNCPTTTATLTFRNPLDPSQSVAVKEQNYGMRVTNPAQVYTISGCNGVASYSPASPIAPASDGTGAATINITPVVQVAPSGLSCTVNATDNANQTIPINASIGRTYTPSATGGGIVTGNATVTVSEQNYDSSPPGGFTVANVSGPCSASVTGSSMSTDGTYTFSTTYNVSFTQSGVLCVITYQDAYGQQTSIQTQQQAAGVLSSWPAFVELPASGQALQTSMVSSPRTVGFYLNALLGGGTAVALSPCGVNQGRAFLDSGFSQVDANDHDPFGQGFTTDSSGCISGPGGANAVLNEPGYSGTLASNGTCSTYVTTSYNPASAQGPTVLVTSQGAVGPTSLCNIAWVDHNTTQQNTSVGFQVVASESVVESDNVPPCGRQKVGADYQYNCFNNMRIQLNSTCYGTSQWEDKALAAPYSGKSATTVTVYSPPLWGAAAWTSYFMNYVGGEPKYTIAPVIVTTGCPGG